MPCVYSMCLFERFSSLRSYFRFYLRLSIQIYRKKHIVTSTMFSLLPFACYVRFACCPGLAWDLLHFSFHTFFSSLRGGSSLTMCVCVRAEENVFSSLSLSSCMGLYSLTTKQTTRHAAVGNSSGGSSFSSVTCFFLCFIMEKFGEKCVGRMHEFNGEDLSQRDSNI